MIYQVMIKPSNVEFSIDSEQTILSAAMEQDVILPYRCKVGACMTCICKKIEGEVEYRHLEPMLTYKEQQQGWIFPCQAYVKSHLILTFEE